MRKNGNGIPHEIFKPLWQYIPAADHATPGAPAREAVRKEWTLFWERLRTRAPLQLIPKQELHAIPQYLLNWAAPPPSSTQGVMALQAALEYWLTAEDPSLAVQVVVGAPGSGLERIVRDLARHLQWRCIEPPTPEEILAGGEEWLDQVLEESDEPLVIPALGKCYLRHHDGLDLMNRLLDWLAITKRRYLVVCDSWAWTFLTKAVQIDAMLPMPWTLAPFHAARLQFWLPSLARRTYRGAFVFRYVNSGELVFPYPERDILPGANNGTNHNRAIAPEGGRSQRDKFADWVSVDYFLKQLGAHSRGIPGVAWAYWRQCLKISADAEIDKDVLAEAAGDEGYTVWVQSWSQLKLPFVPAWAGTQELFVLHALMLHRGLTADLLAEILPYSDNQVRQILYRLRNADLVNNVQETWRVTLMAYPAVRQFLASEGYLVDAF